MLSIDEVIEDLKYDIEIDMYIHDIAPQIAEWLEELKEIKSNGRYVQGNKAGQKIGYRNAIDDFVNACKENIMYKTFGLRECDIEKIAEQLKVGGNNDRL